MSGQPIATALPTNLAEQPSDRVAALFDCHYQRIYHLARRLTSSRPVAILIDGEVVTAPTVRSAVSDSAWINGDYTQAEAERIARGIGLR